MNERIVRMFLILFFVVFLIQSITAFFIVQWKENKITVLQTRLYDCESHFPEHQNTYLYYGGKVENEISDRTK